jgi:hypothetical protein
MDNITYRVHSANIVPSSTTVLYKGQPVTAVLDSLEVQMIPVDDSARHRTLTLRFIGADMDAARKQFALNSEQLVMIKANPKVAG